jgi:glucose-1-phosphate thymidylyltransferase
MKGIVLAGGAGTRLHPLTLGTSKQLLPVYNKPMIYYPLSTLMLAGIRDILVISTPRDLPRFEALLGDGARLGVRLSYAVQPSPGGLAQAFLIGEEFIAGERVALVLGDNLFFGHGLSQRVQAIAAETSGATIFAHAVKDPERYGVVELDAGGRAVSIMEKPAAPRSSFAVPGLYFYSGDVSGRARALLPSARGELEITDLNLSYLRDGLLRVQQLGRGVAWMDTGTPQSLLQAANFVEAIEERQGLMIGAIEEVAYRMGFIDVAGLRACAENLPPGPYAEYLAAVAEGQR